MKNILLIVAAMALLSACCDPNNGNMETTVTKDVFARGKMLENNPNFTGNAWLDMFISTADSMDCTVGNVTFE